MITIELEPGIHDLLREQAVDVHLSIEEYASALVTAAVTLDEPDDATSLETPGVVVESIAETEPDTTPPVLVGGSSEIGDVVEEATKNPDTKKKVKDS